MVLHLRAQLLAGDFAANVKLLQAYPPADGALLAATLRLCHALANSRDRLPSSHRE